MLASHDVIVAGAGPVGLFLACELALAGCTVLVLDKAATPDSPFKRLPFGLRGLTAPSIEALARRGLLDRLAIPQRLKTPFSAAASAAAPRQAGHFAGIPLDRDLVDTARWPYRLPAATPASLVAEMAELETVLAERAQALGVAIRRGCAVAGFVQDADGVTVSAGAGAGGDALRCAWLVGCDGARSAVRKAGGFDFAGTEPQFTGYSASVELVDADLLRPGRVQTPDGMYFQSQPGILALQDADGGAFHDAGRPVTRAHLEAVLRRISGTRVGIASVHLAATWTDRARQATRYRAGRVLLAGDAAHIHAPLGGQGLNLGLGDAMNLGWKLAAAVRGAAPPGLLDSYHAERHPVGARVLDWSRAQVALMRPDPHARALYAIVRDLLATRDGATTIAGRLWGISIQYELGGNHPLVGRSVPAFAFADGTTVDAALRPGRGLLLDFGHDAALPAVADAFHGRLAYLPVHARERLGLCALLVRPDGIVAWAGDGTPDLQALRQAAARWFGT
ncbi:FAD-dependent oxidoreductase [uncultured Massilia sp.]|uniref:FAD-dependent oxidoreductase n=1 Tax=uncultured Massilia sp. TaxID=169973 RepID=UPI0025F01142|nr:FAD-dependent oxidoreductase [uncultured Massilia sp.]